MRQVEVRVTYFVNLPDDATDISVEEAPPLDISYTSDGEQCSTFIYNIEQEQFD